jgi:hypothetical protein
MEYESYTEIIQLHGSNGIFPFSRPLCPIDPIADSVEPSLFPFTAVREFRMVTFDPAVFHQRDREATKVVSNSLAQTTPEYEQARFASLFQEVPGPQSLLCQ